MKYIANDGKIYDTVEEAQKADDRLEQAEKMKAAREAEKETAYKEVQKKLKEANEALQAYLKKYENVSEDDFKFLNNFLDILTI